MKHIFWITLIAIITLFVALAQYFLTDIPGRLVFWPMLFLFEIRYLSQHFTKVF